MSSLSCFLLFTLSLAVIAASPSEKAAAAAPSAYEALESYGFPVGLLPKGVTSYTLDSATGKFSVTLNGTCSFSIQGYDLKYRSKITGTISAYRIRDLTGIQVKVLLFWVNIIEVTKSGDQMELSVGIASADFPVDSFYESPQCGCGFDCVSKGEMTGRRFSFKRLVVPLLEV